MAVSSRRRIGICAAAVIAGVTLLSPIAGGEAPAGFERVAPEPGSATVRLQVRSRPVPHIGDLDIIVGEARLVPDSKVIVTLEALGEPLFPARQLASLLPAALREGATNTGRVPVLPREQPILAGVFVCSDSSGEGACLWKRAEPLAGLGDDLPLFTVPQEARRVPDRIYYFAPLILEEEKLLIPHFNSQTDLEKVLTSGATTEISRKDVMRALALNKLFYSLPLAVQDGAVILDLPHFDRERFNGKENAPED